jgi:hypothetical protein
MEGLLRIAELCITNYFELATKMKLARSLHLFI